MVSGTRRRTIERPPSRVAGVIYVAIGIFALGVAAFVMFFEGTLGAVTNFRTGFGIVIALYGAFRIFTGISMIRRAGKWKAPVVLNGHSSEPTPPMP